jgi:hypothetical protein
VEVRRKTTGEVLAHGRHTKYLATISSKMWALPRIVADQCTCIRMYGFACLVFRCSCCCTRVLIILDGPTRFAAPACCLFVHHVCWCVMLTLLLFVSSFLFVHYYEFIVQLSWPARLLYVFTLCSSCGL